MGVPKGCFAFSVSMNVPVGTTSLTPSVFVNDVGTYVVNNLTAINLTAQRNIYQPGSVFKFK